MSTSPAVTTFTRRQFLVYELVMDGRAHDQAAREVDADVAQHPEVDPDELLSWAQWTAPADTTTRDRVPPRP